MFPMGTSICPGGGLSWTLLFACVHQARYYVIVDPYTYSLMYGLPGARRVQPLVHRLLWRIYAETRQICARGASYCVAKCRLFDRGNCSGATGYSKLVDDRGNNMAVAQLGVPFIRGAVCCAFSKDHFIPPGACRPLKGKHDQI